MVPPRSMSFEQDAWVQVGEAWQICLEDGDGDGDGKEPGDAEALAIWDGDGDGDGDGFLMFDEAEVFDVVLAEVPQQATTRVYSIYPTKRSALRKRDGDYKM